MLLRFLLRKVIELAHKVITFKLTIKKKLGFVQFFIICLVLFGENFLNCLFQNF